MPDTEPTGTPYTPSMQDTVDEWSRNIYRLLSDWPAAKGGRWSRWEPGYLLLEIDKVGDEPIEPTVIYTADEELTVTFGYWETHNPGDLDGGDDVEAAANGARRLVDQWLTGEIRTAVYWDRDDKWCGTTLIDQSDLIRHLENGANWIKDFNPRRVEVRSPRRSQWQFFSTNESRIKMANR